MTLAPSAPPSSERRALMVSKGWVQGVALVVLFGFFVMGILAYRTYSASMPQPERVVAPSGEVVFTGADITAGQKLFQARGLMEYGSILGHGAYLGPDYTADYLRRSTDFALERLRATGVTDPQGALSRNSGPTATIRKPRPSSSPNSRWRPSTSFASTTGTSSARTPPRTGWCRGR